MYKEKITPLQARMLQQFYEKNVYNPDSDVLPRWISKFLGLDKESPPLLYSPERVLNALKITETGERDIATEEFYDLIKKDLISSDKSKTGYFLTSGGLKFLGKLRKGNTGGLEKYSSKRPRSSIRGGGLEKITSAAALILVASGVLLIVSKLSLTGAFVSANTLIDRTNFFGILLIVVGTVLFILKKR